MTVCLNHQNKNGMRKSYWIGLFVTLLLGGCSEDEGLNSGNSGNLPQDGQAYLTVRIADAGANTKAEDDFKNGSETEHTVSDARFFFYDEEGNYVTEASVWNGGQAVTPDGNIEFNGNTVIVLRGLTANDYPDYMVTVLNAPTAFQPANTLTGMQTALSGGIYKSGNSNFIMSTTSYVRTDETPYYVTKLATTDFHAEPIPSTTTGITPVKVYVERLAAKVSLEVASTLSQQADANGRYKLKVTVAGSDNNDGTSAAGATDIYIEFLNWGLNATAKNSYMMKNIDPAWTAEATGLGFSWSDPTNFRSYWGKSYNYNDAATGYPESAGDATVTTGKLNYISGNSISTTLASPAYCAENTFGAEVAKKSSARTSILLKAKICDKDGTGLDMVRYNGMLFKQDYYLSYVLNALKSSLNAWILKSGTAGGADATYAQIDKSHVELVNIVDGKVKVQLKKKESDTGNSVETAEQLYKRSGTEGSYTYTAFTEQEITGLDNTLAGFNTNNPAIGYTGGQMYYNIPIEHLRAFETNQTDPKEGNYGVVRNHHYVVTINKLENVGKGIFDPDEAIVPGGDEGTAYYVGASIHILSWKIVEKEVEL